MSNLITRVALAHMVMRCDRQALPTKVYLPLLPLALDMTNEDSSGVTHCQAERLLTSLPTDTRLPNLKA